MLQEFFPSPRGLMFRRRTNCFGFLEEFGALALAWARDQNQTFRFGVGGVESFDGRDGGLAPLAGAIQDAALGGAFQNFGLARVGIEVELLAGEVTGCLKGSAVPERRARLLTAMSCR